MTHWNNDDRRELEKLLGTPFMQRALAALKDICRVPGRPQALAPGYDPVALAGLAYSHAQGQSSVFEALEALTAIPPEKKPLPPEFERTPRPKSQEP